MDWILTRTRRLRLLGLIPVVFFSCVYFFIALSKGISAFDELNVGAESDLAHRLLLALYQSSVAVFFTTIGMLTLVRKAPVRRQTRLMGWVLPLAPTAAMAAVGFYEPREFPLGIILIATFFVVFGTLFTLYSLRHLGRHFGYVADVRGLVTSGPYRWVRHPLYGGEAVTIIGLIIVVANPVTVTAFIVAMALQIWRAKVEEQALLAAFPEYREYAARTPMLIPLLRLPWRPMSPVTTVE